MNLHNRFLQLNPQFDLTDRKATGTSAQLPPTAIRQLFFAVLLLFWLEFLPRLSAQQSSGLELHLLAGRSDAVWIDRDHPLPISGSGVVNSGASPTFEFQLRHALPLSEHWQWVNGLAFGVDSYKLNPYVDKDFNRFGSEYSENYINAGI
jgi:hypothetical protein